MQKWLNKTLKYGPVTFLRVHSCKLSCKPQKYTFLENGVLTTLAIYILKLLFTQQQQKKDKTLGSYFDVVQIEQQTPMAFWFRIQESAFCDFHTATKYDEKYRVWWKEKKKKEDRQYLSKL